MWYKWKMNIRWKRNLGKNTKCAKREPFMVTMDIIQNEDRVQYSANTYQFPQPFRNKKMHETFNASYY